MFVSITYVCPGFWGQFPKSKLTVEFSEFHKCITNAFDSELIFYEDVDWAWHFDGAVLNLSMLPGGQTM